MKKNTYLMKGNEAIAEGAIRAGCKAFFGYPITPQTEIAAYMSNKMRESGGVYLQAESEISAINMVLGAAATGTRVMTSSSSPGISLKTETISYIAASDLPCVIVDVQRAGPGLGGIQPSQADYFQVVKALGHGDFYCLVYAPSGVGGAVEIIHKAFDKANQYRMPVIVLADGILGQMMEPVCFDDEVKQDKLVEKNWATSGHQEKRPPNIVNSLILNVNSLEQKIVDRFKKYEEIKLNEIMVEEYLIDDAEIVIIAYGSTARIAKTAVDSMRADGEKIGVLRPISLWPFPDNKIEEISKKVKNILVVEMSMGQMILDVKAVVQGRCPVDFCGRTGGNVPTPTEIIDKVSSIKKED